MAKKKLNAVAFFGLLVAFLCLAGCASHAPRVERVQVQQGYPCPECGYPIPDKDVSPNIRIENECPYCGEVFFGKPERKKTRENEGKQVASSGLKSHGPRDVHESDTNYQHLLVGGESFKETETGYSFLYWHFRDSKVKSRRVIPYWTTTRYNLVGR